MVGRLGFVCTYVLTVNFVLQFFSFSFVFRCFYRPVLFFSYSFVIFPLAFLNTFIIFFHLFLFSHLFPPLLMFFLQFSLVFFYIFLMFLFCLPSCFFSMLSFIISLIPHSFVCCLLSLSYAILYCLSRISLFSSSLLSSLFCVSMSLLRYFLFLFCFHSFSHPS